MSLRALLRIVSVLNSARGAMAARHVEQLRERLSFSVKRR